MKKFTRFILGALLVIVLIAAIVFVFNPLRRPKGWIKQDILRLTPIGTSMEDVIKVIESKEDWETKYISDEFGYRRPGKPDPEHIAMGLETIVGEKSIRVFIGDYRNIFTTSVTVFWGFDKDSKLIDVYVWKDVDSL